VLSRVPRPIATHVPLVFMDMGAAKGSGTVSPAVRQGRIDMNVHRHIVLGIAACAALVASAVAIGWLVQSSGHADRPPLFAVVALLFALIAGTAGLVLGVRTAIGLMRGSHDGPK
jgi:hypothetical protein